MIEEYIEKAQIAINEYLKSIKKDANTRVYLNVVEKYMNDIYHYVKDNLDSIRIMLVYMDLKIVCINL